MEYFSLIIIILFIIYFLVISRWTLVWLFRPDFNTVPELFKSDKSVTVIVAVRNEENNILNLLSCLEGQDHDKINVIISDDHSEDNTEELVMEFINSGPSRIISFSFIKGRIGEAVGKKAAIERAISISSSDVIITTDADCKMENNWIKSILYHFQNPEVSMVISPVVIFPVKTFFEKLQALEFASLSVSSAASVLLYKPLMCNGANLAFLRKEFIDNGNFSYGADDASGDDTYLMLSISRKNKYAVVYNSFFDGIVTTKPLHKINDLFNQRLRWASKIKKYKERYIRNIGAFLFVINSLLLFLIICSVLKVFTWEYTISLWLLKSITDLIIMYPFLRFTGQRKLLFLFLPLELIYPIYSFFGGIFSFTKMNYHWKGRKIN